MTAFQDSITHRISSRIGALEIGVPVSAAFDGALEAAADALSVAPTSVPNVCRSTIHVASGCQWIDANDSALEDAAAMTAAPSYNMGCTSTQGNMCRRIDDDAIEAVGGGLHANPTGAGRLCDLTGVLNPVCQGRRIDANDDGALETAAVSMAGPPATFQSCQTFRGLPGGCTRIDTNEIDDGALEMTVVSASTPTHHTCVHSSMGCLNIDDAALETAGNVPPLPTMQPACNTMPGWCPRIDSVN